MDSLALMDFRMIKYSRVHFMILIKILKRKTKILLAKRNITKYKAKELKMIKTSKVKNNNKTIRTLFLIINITYLQRKWSLRINNRAMIITKTKKRLGQTKIISINWIVDRLINIRMIKIKSINRHCKLIHIIKIQCKIHNRNLCLW